MLAYSACREAVESVGDALSAYVYLRLLRGVDSRHYDLRRELVAADDGLRLGYYERRELVHANVLHVDVRNERVQHFAFSVAHVALQLREQRDGTCNGHVLEHVLLPVLAERVCVLRHLCREVAFDDVALMLVGNHLEDALAEVVDGVVEFLALTRAWSEHHMACCFEVILALNIVDIAVLAVSLAHNLHLQRLREVVERVAHALHSRSFLEPLLHLLRVLLHLLGEVAVEHLVLLRGVGSGTVQTLLHDREAVEHFRRNVQGKHRHQHHIHEVDHLLAWGDMFFLYCHS